MPWGSGTVSLPFGPCTSTWPLCRAIFTPAGTGIGLRPMRDICSSLAPETQKIYNPKKRAQRAVPLPNLTENFATDFGFAGAAAAHQTLWRRQNVDAQAANDGADICCAEVAARTG